MANTLTNLYPDLYAAVNTVSRELVGFIPAVARDSRAERAALNQTVRVPVTGAETARDITPGPTVPDDGDTTVNNRTITISRSRAVPVRFTGEEIQGLRTQDVSNAQDGYQNIRQERFAQAMRTLVNEVESDIASLYSYAARAYGTAGTTPFGTKDDFSDFAGVAQILDDDGAPTTMRQLVGGSAAWFNLRGVQTGVLQRANEAGTPEALRNGEFGSIHGMVLRNSGQVKSHTAGTLTDVTANANAVGTTELDVETAASTGEIDVSPGDVIEIAGDSNKYVVAEAATAGAGQASTTITIREPGLRQATTDGSAVSIVDDYTANLAFHQNAIQLATRVPALPDEGDMAMDRTVVTDPISGLSFEVAVYPGYRQIHFEVGLAWGYAATKEEHIALLLG